MQPGWTPGALLTWARMHDKFRFEGGPDQATRSLAATGELDARGGGDPWLRGARADGRQAPRDSRVRLLFSVTRLDHVLRVMETTADALVASP